MIRFGDGDARSRHSETVAIQSRTVSLASFDFMQIARDRDKHKLVKMPAIFGSNIPEMNDAK